MNIHPSLLKLSKRLNVWLAAPGLVAAAVYLATLSRSVCPGDSASLTAAAAGLATPSGAASPLFAWAARLAAGCPLATLPVRLNLFSALCGAACATLLFSLLSRLVFFFSCETQSGADRVPGSDLAPLTELSPEALAQNRRLLRLAAAAGCVASFFFTFGAAPWSASTRLDAGLFHLLLLLASLHLLLTYETTLVTRLRIPLLSLSLFLFTLGVSDCAAFIPLLPCYLYFLFMAFFFSTRRTGLVAGLAFAGLAASALAFRAYVLNRTFAADTDFSAMLTLFASDTLTQSYHQLRAFFPSSKWLLVVAQTGLPAMLVLFGMPSLFKDCKPANLLTLLMLTLASAPSFLLCPFSLWTFAQNGARFPVFGYAVAATAAGVCAAACLKLLIAPPELLQDESQNRAVVRQARVASLAAGLSYGLLALLALTALLTPFRSFPYVDVRKNLFADELAREMLGQMKGRSWLISNGHLDKHLLIQAHMLKRPLTIVPLLPRLHTEDIRRLDNSITSDPAFAGLNRVRLQNALSIGTPRFVMEWFSTDPHAADRAMVIASPDVWTANRWLPVPEGFAFGGARAGQAPDPSQTEAVNRAFLDKAAPLLVDRKRQSPQAATLRRLLRTSLGLTSNELGVWLEEVNQPEAALQAYLRATRIDPANISANINAYTLMNTRNLHPELLDKTRKKIKDFENNPVNKSLSLPNLLKTFGSIRQQAFYQLQGQVWSSVGAATAASHKAGKASALSETLAPAAAGQQFLQVGDMAQAETFFQSALAQNPSEAAALTGMASVTLARRDTAGTETWLARASAADAPAAELQRLRLTLSLLKGNGAETLEQLLKATREAPSDPRYWVMLADVLLKQKDLQRVAYEILPALQAALKTQDHYLVQAVRGFMLKGKGERSHKEARLAFLRALSMNASLPDVWTALLDTDIAIGNPDFIESDARSLLSVEPDHALANYLLGSLCLSRRALDRSEDFLRRSIEKLPTAAACNNLSENLRAQRRFEEAETLARQALALQPGFPPSLDTLANVLLDTERLEEAARLAEQADSKSPNTAAYQLTLLRVRAKQGRLADALGLSAKLKASKVALPPELEKELRLLQRTAAPEKAG